VHAVCEVHNEGHRTLLVILKDGYVLKHLHKKVQEKVKIVYMSPGTYGHIFLPGHHHPTLTAENIGDEYVFDPGAVHGFSISVGYMILQIDVYGEFFPEDTHVHI
jgi:hypothetical protein